MASKDRAPERASRRRGEDRARDPEADSQQQLWHGVGGREPWPRRTTFNRLGGARRTTMGSRRKSIVKNSHCSILSLNSRISNPPRQSGAQLKNPGVLLKDPGVLLKDPGVLQKDPGVLQKDPALSEKLSQYSSPRSRA